MSESDHLSGEAFKSLEEAEAALNMPPSKYTIDEADRQLLVLALVTLALSRPGMAMACRQAATEALEAGRLFDRLLGVVSDGRDDVL
jgi:hypothetical protein